MRTTGVIIALVGVLLWGCASSSDGPRPAWMTRVPVDAGAWFGIGGSPDTGDRQADLDRARVKALARLAEEIEVTIRSDETFRESESGGKRTASADVIIQTLTSQHLEGVELVGTYHSQSDGYWFCYSLEKRLWAALKNRDRDALRARILAMMAKADEPATALADRIGTLGAAIGTLSSSRYSGAIVYEKGAVLDDVLRARMLETLSNTVIVVDPASLEVSPERQAEMRIEVSAGDGRRAGVFPIDVREQTGRVLASVRTDETGVFTGTLPIPGLMSGVHVLTVAVSPEALRSTDSSLLSRLPAGALAVTVRPLSVHVRLASDNGQNPPILIDSLVSIITRRFALAVAPDDANSPYSLTFSVEERSAPENAYGITVAFCSVSMIAEKDGSRVSGYASGDAKGAGLSLAQARRNAEKAVLEKLARDPVLDAAIAALMGGAAAAPR